MANTYTARAALQKLSEAVEEEKKNGGQYNAENVSAKLAQDSKYVATQESAAKSYEERQANIEYWTKKYNTGLSITTDENGNKKQTWTGLVKDTDTGELTRQTVEVPTWQQYQERYQAYQKNLQEQRNAELQSQYQSIVDRINNAANAKENVSEYQKNIEAAKKKYGAVVDQTNRILAEYGASPIAKTESASGKIAGFDIVTEADLAGISSSAAAVNLANQKAGSGSNYQAQQESIATLDKAAKAYEKDLQAAAVYDFQSQYVQENASEEQGQQLKLELEAYKKQVKAAKTEAERQAAQQRATRVQELLEINDYYKDKAAAVGRLTDEEFTQTYTAQNVTDSDELLAQASALLKQADAALNAQNMTRYMSLVSQAEALRTQAYSLVGGDAEAKAAVEQRLTVKEIEAGVDKGREYLAYVNLGKQKNYVPRLREAVSNLLSKVGFSAYAQDYVDQMTTTERNTYYWYLGKGDEATAQEYFSYLEPTLEQRFSEASAEDAADFAEKHPVLATVFNALSQTIVAPALGVAATVQNVGKSSDEAITGGAVYQASDINQGTVEGLAKDIQSRFDTTEENAQFWAGTVVSMANNTAQTSIFRIGALAGGVEAVTSIDEWIPLALMSTNAATDTIRQQISNGSTVEKALLYGAAVGGAEVLTEKMGLDSWFDLASGNTGEALFKSVTKNGVDLGGLRKTIAAALGAGQQAITEGTEELISTFVSGVADVLINGESSTLVLNQRAFMAEGATQQEAFWKAMEAFAEEAVQSFAGGAVSGGVFGTVAIPSSLKNSNAIGRAVRELGNQEVYALVEYGLEFDQQTTTYQIANRLTKAIDNNENYVPSDVALTELSLAIENDTKAITATLSEDTTIGTGSQLSVTASGLISTGVVTANEARVMDVVLNKVATNQKVTDAEIHVLRASSPKIRSVLSDYLGYNIANGSDGAVRAAIQVYQQRQATAAKQREAALKAAEILRPAVAVAKGMAAAEAQSEVDAAMASAESYADAEAEVSGIEATAAAEAGSVPAAGINYAEFSEAYRQSHPKATQEEIINAYKAAETSGGGTAAQTMAASDITVEQIMAEAERQGTAMTRGAAEEIVATLRNRSAESKKSAQSNNTSERKQYSINDSFADELDNWDGKSDKTFSVGATSDVLKSIGVNSREIVWHGAKISKVMKKHPEMTMDVIKQVPTILEDPNIILKSASSESRLIVVGELNDAAGNPVLTVLELQPTGKDGRLLNLNIIASAYGKSNNVKNFIQNSEVLYINEDAKRTEGWLQGLGLQLPSDTTSLGSIGSITYQDGTVNISGIPWSQLSLSDEAQATSDATSDTDTEAEKADTLEVGSGTEGKYSVENPNKLAEWLARDYRKIFGKRGMTIEVSYDLPNGVNGMNENGKIVLNGQLGDTTVEGTFLAAQDHFVYVLSHEVGHSAQGNTKAGFEDQTDSIVAMYRALHPKFTDAQLEERINKELVKNRNYARRKALEGIDVGFKASEFGRQDALEEVACNMLGEMMVEYNVLNKMLPQHQSLIQKVKTRASEVLENIRKLNPKASKPGEISIAKAYELAAEGIEQTLTEALDTVQGKTKTASEGGVRYALSSVDSNPATHSAEEMVRINEYLASYDEGLADFFRKYEANQNERFARYEISEVSARQAGDLEALTGVDVSGYSNYINKNAVIHILKRHGKSGKQDQSMREIGDAARIGYVLTSYDSVAVLRDKNGDPVYSSEFLDKNHAPAMMVKFSKAINGSYYVVEAVPQNDYKKIWVVSAYMENKKSGTVTQSSDANAPETTPIDEIASPVSADSNVAEDSGSVKSQFSLSDDEQDYAPTFYSYMGKVVDSVKQTKLGAASVVPMLRGKGVKAEEIKWSGIEQFLEGKKSVTKQELQEFIAGSQLQIEETVRRDGQAISYTEAEQQDLDVMQNWYERRLNQAMDLWVEAYNEEMPLELMANDDVGAAISREVIARNGGIRGFSGIDALSDAERALYSEVSDGIHRITLQMERIREAAEARQKNLSNTRWSEYKLGGGENYREYVFKLPGSTYRNDAMNAHWHGETGILAHARVQDFDAPNGKMLFIEEIQSDWHNAGNKYGYGDIDAEMARLQSEYEERVALLDKWKAKLDEYNIRTNDYGEYIEDYYDVYDEYMSASARVEDSQRRIRNAKRGNFVIAPDAPFKQNYHEFVLKRLLREAAENGYDSIGWTTADIQSDRWSDEYAEGYRIEYDQDIPKFLNKYGKQWGARVGRADIRTKELTAKQEANIDRMASFLEDPEGYIRDEKGIVEVWTLPITEAMKESVLYAGQPQYSLSDDENDWLLENFGNSEPSTFDRFGDETYDSGTAYVSYDASRTMAKALLSAYGSTADTEDIAAKYRQASTLAEPIYNWALNGMHGDFQPENTVAEAQSEIMSLASEMADMVIDSAMSTTQDNEEVRKYLRDVLSEGIYIADADKEDTARAMGYESWGEMRKARFGVLGNTTSDPAKGVEVSDIYSSIIETFPGAVKGDATEQSGQLAEIIEAYDKARAARNGEYNPLEADREQYREEIAGRIYNELFDKAVDYAKEQYGQELAIEKAKARRLEREALEREKKAAELKKNNAAPKLIENAETEAKALHTEAEDARLMGQTDSETISEGMAEGGFTPKTQLELWAEEANAKEGRELTAQERMDQIVAEILKRNNAPKQTKVSRTYSNTLVGGGLISEAEQGIEGLRAEDATYEVETEKKSLETAVKRLDNNYIHWYEELPNKTTDWEAADLDTAMLIFGQVQSESAASGDYSESIRWAKLIQERGRKGGQFLQAFRKYTKTTIGQVIEKTKDLDERYINERGDNAALDKLRKKNDKAGKELEQLTIDNKRLDAEYDKLMEQYNALRAELEAARKDRNGTKGKISRAKDNLLNAIDKQAQLDAENVRLMGELDRLEDMLSWKLAEVSNVSRENRNLVVQARSLETRLQRAQQRFTDATERNAELKEALARLRAQERGASDMAQSLIDRLTLRVNKQNRSLENQIAAISGEVTEAKRTKNAVDKASTAEGIRKAVSKTGSEALGEYLRGIANDLDSALTNDKKAALINEMAQFATILDACKEGDKDSLIDLILRQAAVRNTPVRRSIKKSMEAQDWQYLHDVALTQMMNIAEDYKKVPVGKKLAGWQYLAQLLNPKTSLRNIFSNVAFYVQEGTAKNIGAFLDSGMGLLTGVRTVGASTLRRGDTGRLRAASDRAKRSAIEVSLDVSVGNGGNKYTGSNRTFKRAQQGISHAVGRTLSSLEKVNGYSLTVTDEFFKGAAYQSSINSYAKLVEKGVLTQGEAEQLATEQMLYNTFQDETAIGSALEWLHNGLNGTTKWFKEHDVPVLNKLEGLGLGDFVIKYRKVPGALVTRAIEFSPAGVLRTIYNTGMIVKYSRQQSSLDTKARAEGAQSVTEEEREAVRAKLIDAQHAWSMSFARALTGSAMVAAFAALASKGIIGNADDEEDKDAKAVNTAEGLSGTQINLSALRRFFKDEDAEWQAGDDLLDLGWLDPTGSVITMGTMIANASNDKGENTLSRWWGANKGMALQSFSDLSMMDTLNDLLYTLMYHDDESDLSMGTEFAITFATSSLTSMWPSVFRQVAQAMDQYYRDTYGGDGAVYDALRGHVGEDTAQAIQTAVNEIAVNIPFLRQTVDTKLDSFGRERTYGDDTITNVLNALINPSKYAKYNPSEASRELRRVYNETGGASIYPNRNAPSSLQFGDERIDLTPDQKRTWQTTMGQTYDQMVGEMMSGDVYQAANNEGKVQLLKDLESYVEYKAKQEVYREVYGEEYTNDLWTKTEAGMDLGIEFGNMRKILYDTSESNMPSLLDDDGETISGSRESQIMDYLNDTTYDDGTKLELYGIIRGSVAASSTQKLREVMDAGLSFKEASEVREFYNELNATREANLDGMRDRDYFEKYLREEGYTEAQREAITERYKFYTQIPQEENATITKMVEGGMDYDTAYDITANLSALEPEYGEGEVSTAQKYDSVISDGSLTVAEKQMAVQAIGGSNSKFGSLNQNVAANLMQVYKQTGVTSVLSIQPADSVTIDYKEYEYSDAQYAASESAYLNIMNQMGGGYLTDAKLVSGAKDIASNAAKYAAMQTGGYEPDIDSSDYSAYRKALQAQDVGLDLSYYVAVKAQGNSYTADKDADGDSISGSKKAKVVAYLKSLGLTSAQYNFFYSTVFGYSG